MLADILEHVRGTHVAVLGDLILDEYLDATMQRISREDATPVLDIGAQEFSPGGAGNVARNVVALGGECTLITATGDDPAGRTALAALAAAGVQARGPLACPARQTRTVTRVSAHGHQVARLDRGSTDPVCGDVLHALLGALRTALAQAQALIVSDYEHGVVSEAMLRRLPQLLAQFPGVAVVVDAKHPGRLRALRPTAVTPNRTEAVQVLGLDQIGPDPSWAARHGERLLELTGADLAAVTLDSDGAVLIGHGTAPRAIRPHPVSAVRAIGAGDVFAAALALGLGARVGAPIATELACAAASLAVEAPLTALCTSDQLAARERPQSKVVPASRLGALGDSLRREGRSVAFTNGCFDILHSGHVAFLQAARGSAQTLVVGLNSDRSVRALKGPGRPVNTLADRVAVLAALECVDYIVEFDEATAESLIASLRPDRFVKGAGYSLQTLPEAALLRSLGIDIEFLPVSEAHLTSRIVQRIRAAAS